MKDDVKERIDGAAAAIVQSRVEEYRKNWSREREATGAALTTPAVVMFRYADEERDLESISFDLMPPPLVDLFFSSSVSKEALLNALNTFLKQPLACAAVVVSESWAVQAQTMEEAAELDKHSTLRDAPGSVSAIQAQIYYADNDSMTIVSQAMKDGQPFETLRRMKLAKPKDAQRFVGFAESVELMERA